MAYYKIEQITASGQNLLKVSTRCPHCRHNGTFETLRTDDVHADEVRIFGVRRCPNPKCHGFLFFVYYKDYLNSYLETTYPKATIPFSTENIPDNIVNAFKEALISHSNNCFIAAAIMIRKTLEEICKDRNAEGRTLYDRLVDLSSKIVLPTELREGMQDLRLLGNDAAHIGANTFAEVGQEEVEISIEFTTEILKGVYQYESLLKRIRGLKEKKPVTK